MPLAEAWKSNHASVDAWKLGLDGVIEAFPVSGKALKVVYGGITCGLVHDVVYYIVPEDLSEDCLIHADFEDDADAVEK